MFPHALIKSWCKPCTTETWLWYHLPLTGCQVWIKSWWVRDCILHLSSTVNSGWPRAWSPVQSRPTQAASEALCAVCPAAGAAHVTLGEGLKHVIYGTTCFPMVNALCLTKNKLITEDLHHICTQFILCKIKVFCLYVAIHRRCSLGVGLISLKVEPHLSIYKIVLYSSFSSSSEKVFHLEAFYSFWSCIIDLKTFYWPNI